MSSLQQKNSHLNMFRLLLWSLLSKFYIIPDERVTKIYIRSFWRNCCKALAVQYLEKNSTLLAIPYLLAIHEVWFWNWYSIKLVCKFHPRYYICFQVNEAIQHLSTANYYREAWIIAKLHKESEDQIFAEIAKSWVTFLEDHGNLDGAALVYVKQ